MNHRLTEHDYASRGFYFITAATYPRRNLFSTISGYQTHLNQLGEIVREEWLRLHREQPLLEQQEFAILTPTCSIHFAITQKTTRDENSRATKTGRCSGKCETPAIRAFHGTGNGRPSATSRCLTIRSSFQ